MCGRLKLLWEEEQFIVLILGNLGVEVPILMGRVWDAFSTPWGSLGCCGGCCRHFLTLGLWGSAGEGREGAQLEY